MPAPLASWNPARDAWETSHSHIDLFSGLSAVWSETWPSWGMWADGVAYELPMSAPLMAGSASSSPPGLLKTPTSQLAVNGGSQHPDKRKAGGHGPTLADEVEHLLPTPTAVPYGSNQSPSPGAAVRPSLDTLAPMLLPSASDADALTRSTTRETSADSAEASALHLSSPTMTLLPTPKSSTGGPDATTARPSGSKGTTNLAGALLPLVRD